MESKDVVIAVLVLDKKRVKHVQDARRYAYMIPETANLRSAEMRDLTAEDFHIFEDGKEQKIERLTTERIRVEETSAGVGEWVYSANAPNPDLEMANSVGAPTGPFQEANEWLAYSIAYPRPPSEQGSCHQIAVRVDRRDALVYTRGGYCNLGDSAADPLGGTKLGKRLERDLNSRKKSETRLFLAAFGSFRDRPSILTTNITIGFSATVPGLVKCTKPPRIDVMGIVDASNGTVVARFSDLQSLWWTFTGEAVPGLAHSVCFVWPNTIPYQYETQLDLAPGAYSLRVAFTDGRKFGRAETSFVVGPFDGKQLAISDVTLSRYHREVSTQAPDEPAAFPGSYIRLVSRGFEVTPTAAVSFEKGDPFAFYFEIYAPPERKIPAGKIEGHLRIVDAKTGQVVKYLQPVNAALYARPDDPVIPIGGGIDISALPSGSYRLEVQAIGPAGDSTTWHSASFTVE